MKQQFWALTTWANRGSAVYVGIDCAIGKVTIDAYGRKSGTARYGSSVPRRAVKIDDGGTTAYVMYDSDSAGNVPVVKIVET